MMSRNFFWITVPTRKFGMCTEVRRSISRWTIRLLPPVVAAVHPAAVVVEVEAVRVPRPAEARAEVALAQLPAQVLELRVVEAQLPLLVPVPRMDVVQARLQVQLLLLFRLRVVRRPLAVEVEHKPVLVVVVRAVEAVAAAEADQLWLATLFARVPQFPAWRSSTPCSQQAPIRMWH